MLDSSEMCLHLPRLTLPPQSFIHFKEIIIQNVSVTTWSRLSYYVVEVDYVNRITIFSLITAHVWFIFSEGRRDSQGPSLDELRRNMQFPPIDRNGKKHINEDTHQSYTGIIERHHLKWSTASCVECTPKLVLVCFGKGIGCGSSLTPALCVLPPSGYVSDPMSTMRFHSNCSSNGSFEDN